MPPNARRVVLFSSSFEHREWTIVFGLEFLDFELICMLRVLIERRDPNYHPTPTQEEFC